jgi:hypothetical protein
MGRTNPKLAPKPAANANAISRSYSISLYHFYTKDAPVVSSSASLVDAYLAQLPPLRGEVVGTVRDFVNEHLPPGYEETMNWGMICWEIPLSRYPATYGKRPLPYVALAAQTRHYCLYLMCNLSGHARLCEAYWRAGKKLEMGKTCIRFRTLEDLLLEEIASSIGSVSVERLIELYEAKHLVRQTAAS